MKFPEIPGATPFEKFKNLVRQVIVAPKSGPPPRHHRTKRSTVLARKPAPSSQRPKPSRT